MTISETGRPVFERFALGFPWPTFDPFLFCAHHDDAYPAGTPDMAVPPEQRVGRHLGMDFTPRDGFRMYHGSTVPGFPAHPHRGFETVTLVRTGLVDHSDSLGAAARFGNGDVQWITTGAGLVHSEMIPLVHGDRPNPAEFFQIWLNLPAASKMADPHFLVHWAEQRRVLREEDAEGRAVEIGIVAGAWPGQPVPEAPPSSWAADPENGVAIWTLRLAPGATLTLPPARPGVGRTLYVFRGSAVDVGGDAVRAGEGARVDASGALPLTNGEEEAEILVLQGRPIGEPVAQQGPFVMNSPGELRQTMLDFQRTGFGGWPWATSAPVHPREQGRFARFPDGREETPTR